MSQAIQSTVRYVIRGVGALLIGIAIGGAPALTYAQHSMGGGGGGGGGHFGGGGHIGGGGHAGGGGFSGGGHGFGGGAVHFGGFGSHSYGGYGGHAFAAPHYGFSGHSYGNYGGRYASPAAHGFSYAGARYGYVTRPGGHPGTVAPHPGVGAPSATYYYHGGWYPAHAWAGGYWHGAYWPHCWYYPGWAWYLPVLPVGYVTYWWGGVPYYYWNSLYYTWNPAQNGYIVTDPPPTEETEGSADAGGSYEQAPQGGGSGSGSAADVYVYPRNGQTQEQTENDRYECHSWAASQSGFDPTRPQQNGDPADYHRAMVACLDARGYSAR